MKAKSIARIVCAASVAALCVLGVTACSGSSGLTGGVAATVNGEEIAEDDVTTYIQSFRESYSLTDESSWKEWLETYGYTAESVRSQVIDMFVEEKAIKLAAADQGISVSSETIDSYVNSIKSNYSTDAEWKSALEQVGMTEDEYRESIELSLLEEQLQAVVAPETDPTDDELLSYCQMYSSYFDGAKRSSHILFSSDDTETAQSVLDQINAGTLDFATAAQTYSIDTSSATDGGDVGWDVLSSFVTEYTDALDTLSKGEVSGLTTSSYGIHIIKCTDVYEAPESFTSISQMPDDLVSYLKDILISQNQSTAFSTYIDNYIEGLTVVKNDMPKNVPYYVEVSETTTTTTTETTDDTSTE